MGLHQGVSVSRFFLEGNNEPIFETMPSSSPNPVLTALAQALPAIELAAPSRAELRDATEAHGLTGHADALALPRSAEEVAAVLALVLRARGRADPARRRHGLRRGRGPAAGRRRARPAAHEPHTRARPRAVARGGRGRRDDRHAAAPRARERVCCSRPTRAPRSSRRSAATSRRTPAARTRSSTARPARG